MGIRWNTFAAPTIFGKRQKISALEKISEFQVRPRQDEFLGEHVGEEVATNPSGPR